MPTQHTDPIDPSSWEDARTKLQVGYTAPFDAAWVLTKSRAWPLIAGRGGMLLFGLLLFAIVVATVLLSPTTDSHFIYTDF